jgi:hypothetical protein
MNDCTPQTVTISTLHKKPIEVHFDQPHSSSDGGALLLKAADQAMGLTDTLAKGIRDGRQAGKVKHQIPDLVRQRVFALACGYADGNDADHLRQDPVHQVLTDKEPDTSQALGSQPTLSRFENAVSRTELLKMSLEMARQILHRQAQRLQGQVHQVTIDIDGTEDPAHGEQEGACFSGYYDSTCFQPLLTFVTFNEEMEQFLIASLLRPGTAGAQGTSYVLKKLIPMLCDQFPGVKILVRLDGGFSQPELLDRLDVWAELCNLEYVVGMAGNTRLRKACHVDMERAMEQCRQQHRTVSLYGETRYQAGSWAAPRRVIYKAEVVWACGKLPRENDRYVITNRSNPPETIYSLYRRRGDSENRIKELKGGLEMDRTSCSGWEANQFRLLLTAAAFSLWQYVRSMSAKTEAAHWQVGTLRERLVKIGARVKSSVRRLQFFLPLSYPWQELWCTLMSRLQLPVSG